MFQWAISRFPKFGCNLCRDASVFPDRQILFKFASVPITGKWIYPNRINFVWDIIRMELSLI